MSAAGELLTAAKELLLKGRTKGAQARDGEGNAVDPTDPTAERFSLHGALIRASWDRRDSTGVDTALQLLNASNIQDPHLDGFSAHASDEDLTKRFDDAIKSADGNPLEQKSERQEKKDEGFGFDPLAGGGDPAEATALEAPQTQTNTNEEYKQRYGSEQDGERVREGLNQDSDQTPRR